MEPQGSSRCAPAARARSAPPSARGPTRAAAAGGGARGRGRHLPAPPVRGDRPAARRLAPPGNSAPQHGGGCEARGAPEGREQAAQRAPTPRLLAALPKGFAAPCRAPRALRAAVTAPQGGGEGAKGSPCRAERFAPGKRELHEGCGRPMGPHNAGELRRAECRQ